MQKAPERGPGHGWFLFWRYVRKSGGEFVAVFPAACLIEFHARAVGLQSKEQKFSATLVPLVTRKGHSLQQHSISKLMIERSLRGAASERRLGTRRARAQVLGASSFFSCVRLTLSRLPREFSFRVPFWIRPPSSLPPDARTIRLARPTRVGCLRVQ